MNRPLLYLLLLSLAQPLHPMLKPTTMPAPAKPPAVTKPAAQPAAAAQPVVKPQVPLQPQPAITGYKAAGILPFGVAPNGNVHLLAGLEKRSFRNGPFQIYAMDFGGKIDPQDNNNPIYSAAREGAEELTFIYDESPADFQKILDAYKKFGRTFNVNASGARTYQRILQKIQKDEVTGQPALYNNNNNFYIMYFPRFSYRDTNQLFQNRINQYGARIPHEWHEKSQLVWLPVKDVINAIKARGNNWQAPLVVNGITIWPYFADSLIQAYQRGILENLR